MQRRPNHLLLPIALIALLLIGLLPNNQAYAASNALEVRLRTSFPVVNSGDWAVLQVDYSCSSIISAPCQDVVISSVLPPELARAAGDVRVLDLGGLTTTGYNPTTSTATWAFNGNLNPGDAGTFELHVRFAPGSTPDGTIATLRAQISGSNAPPSLSKPLPLAASAQPRARAAKRFVSGGVLDLPTVYQVEVCVPSSSGAVDLSSVAMTDALPTGAVFVGATDGGVYNAGANTITWPAASILVSAGQTCLRHTVTVTFPDASFNVGDEIQNDLSAEVTALNGATFSLSDSDVRLIQPPTPNPGFSKSGPGTAQVGDTVRYTFDTRNSGTSPLDNHSFTDILPAELRVSQIFAADYTPAGSIRLQIDYQTNQSAAWAGLPGAPFTAAACVNVAPASGGGCAGTLTLNPGEYITALRYSYLDQLPYGFAVSGSGNGFAAEVVSAPTNQIIVNSADATFSFNGHAILEQSSVRTRVVEYTPGARPSLTKSASPTLIHPGDLVTYTLALNNTSFQGLTTDLVNPQLVDLLQTSLIYEAGSQQVTAKPAGAPDPSFDIVPNYHGTGRSLLRWRWVGGASYSLPPGESITLAFQARVAPYTPAGSLTNTANLAGWDNLPDDILLDSCSGSTADSDDLDGDGDTQEQICSSSITSVTLASAANSSAQKLVKGQLDTAWTFDPQHGFTVPGGSADYRLIITNTGTIAISDLILLDILPWVGDVGVQRFDQARDSEWRPFLTAPIAVPAGASVFYSTQNNPCRQPDLGIDPDAPGCSAPTWSSEPPADITSVQSFKISFGGLVLSPGDSVEVEVNMRAPYGGTAGEVAWNSFGYRARAVGASDYLLAPDPPRVGIERQDLKPPAYGNYIWLDQNKDGLQTAGEPGVNSARVELFRDSDGLAGPSAGDTLVDFTVSGPDDDGNPGYYLFSSFPITDSRYLSVMPPGNYYARVTPPLGYSLTAQNQGADDTIDSDVSQTTRYTPVTTLDPGEVELTWDAGLTASTAVGNYVWIDRNLNGLQDETSGDGVNGVTVNLRRTADNSLVATTLTADDLFGHPGYYLFDNLTPGNYYVEFIKPTGFGITAQGAGGTDPQDSDASPASGRTASFSLVANQYDSTRDAGLTLAAGSLTLGNLVWRDLNNDGRYDPAGGEYGIDGVRLDLYRDTNGNGQAEPGESAGSVSSSTRLGQPGWYQFAGLAAGDYIVALNASNFAPGGALEGLRTSSGNEPTPDPDSQNPGDQIDGDDNGDLSGARVVSQAITLSAGGEPGVAVDGDGSSGNQTLDFGLIGGAALGNFVWLDADGDGVQDAGEPGVPGITVDLLDSGGAVLDTATTDGDGRYGFSELSAGSYRVRFSGLPAGHSFSGRDLGGDDALDSDADPATGQTALIALTAGQTDLTWDAGLVATLASIGDRAWDDLNRDGVQDVGEPGINGVGVTLYRANGTQVATTATANVAGVDGVYSFAGLPPGDYYVAFTSLPAGYTASPTNASGDDTADSDADTATRRTATTTLVPGESDPTWDIGIFTYASIGNFVWYDYDRDGVQDAGESGIGGVTVRLYVPGSSTPLATTSTNASGVYRFTNLAPADYYLEFAMPAGYRTSLRDAGGDDAKDSDPSLSTFQTIVTSLAPGEDDTSWDFGIYPTASIGDRAWLDRNANGIQDAGEAAVPGVDVILYDSSHAEIDSTVTDATGLYRFSGLIPGVYSLGFVLPPTFVLSPQDASANTNDGADSDVAPVTLTTTQTTLDPGEDDLTWDIGLYQVSKLGDRVWHDQNADGVQDAGEPGIPGAAVRLYRPGPDGAIGGGDDILVDTQTTGASGTYQFSGLPPNIYYVAFDMPAGYTNVSPQSSAAADGATDSDASPTTRLTPPIDLGSSSTDLTWDMGVYNLASLGDRVWLDADVDGVQDVGEAGVNGVTVTLYRSGGAQVATTTTANVAGADGVYGFAGLTPGSYYLIFSGLPADHAITRRDQGGDDTKDSDVGQIIDAAGTITGATGQISLASGQADLRWDAGIYPTIRVGDRVWLDEDADGVQDAAETTGIDGVRVELRLASDNSLVDYTFTDNAGAYLFSDLFPNTYRIVFSGIPAGYLRSPADQGGDDAQDSDADASLTTIDFTPTSGSDLTRDLGLYQPASLGDYVWHDQNANGVQDAGEPAIAGATARLYSAGADHVFGGGDDVQVGAAATTDASGLYSFTNLTAGFYYVQFDLPAGFDRLSPTLKGGDVTKDSDADPTSRYTAVTELRSGESDPTWDAGFYKLASLGDFVWEDMNGNGRQDDGATGIFNVAVALSGTDGAGQAVSLSASTDINGAYSFTGLAPGSYQVTVTPPVGYQITLRDNASGATADQIDSDADRSTGQMAITTLVSGESDQTWDAGLYRPASLGDRLWEDLNGNGLQGAGEPGVGGRTVTLRWAGPDATMGTAGDNTTATTTTAGDGSYSFTNLIPGIYRVEFGTAPTNYAYTSQDTGADNTIDSDVTPTGASAGNTAGITLVSNQNDPTWDAGLYQLLSLGNRVWNDVDNNGAINGAEAGIDGVTVNLYTGTGTFVKSTVTASGGYYLFTGLTQGNYIVEVLPPAGYISSTGTNGSASGPFEAAPDPDATLDSDDNGSAYSASAVRSLPIALTSGGEPLAANEADALPGAIINPSRDENSNLTLDFGLFQPARVGNLVWLDRDADGVQDGGDETGINGVTVELRRTADDSLVTSTTTAGGGLYQFTNLIPGDYYLVFTNLPASYLRSPLGGGTAATDSDANLSAGETASLTLTPGASDQSWDAGLYQLVRLGNLVWGDLNNNGIFDSASESGIDGVDVNLYRDLNGDGDVADAGETAPLASATTSGGGLYLFDNLTPGAYIVELPASNFSGAGALAASGAMPAYRSSTGTNGSATGAYEGAALADPDGNVDSDDSGTTDGGGNVRSLAVTLRTQDEPLAGVDTDDNNGNLTLDFGVFRPLSLGDLVWNDLNDNKAFNSATESGIDGVTVRLYRDTDSNNAYTAGTDTLVATTTTAGGGLYLFDNLTPGDYVVVIPATNFAAGAPLNLFRSSDGSAAADSAADPDAGDANDDDNGVAGAGGLVSSAAVTLSLDGEPTNDGDASSNSNLSLDFGFYSLSVGNLVFEDKDNNGALDGSDAGINGRTVSLYYDADGSGALNGGETTAIATISTSNGGRYFFGGLRSGGRYQIGVAMAGAGWVSSTGGANGAPTGPYEPGKPVNGNTADSDDNGTQAAGNTVRSALFTLSAGGEPTDESDTALPASTTNPAANDGTNFSIDFGLFNQARMGDTVWLDANGNGVQDGGETTGFGGVTVKLYDSTNALISTTTTLASGIYGFSYLLPGSYYVEFSGLPAAYAISPKSAGGTAATNSDADQASGQTASFTLAANANDTSWDMGLYPRLSLGNLIWDDLNDNGQFDSATEGGIDGVTVELYRDANGSGSYEAGTDTFVASQATSAGSYLFTGLTQGDYLVVVPASNFASGQPLHLYRSSTGANGAASGPYEPALDPDNNLNDDDNGSDAGGLAVTRAISLNPGVEPTTDGDADLNTNLTLDLGFFQALSLGDLVWDDVDNDGLFDSASESGIAGVSVRLYSDANASGAYEAGTDTLVASTTTDGSGVYSFSDLIPGSYLVVLPSAQFAAGQPIAGYTSSTGVNGAASGQYEPAPDPDDPAGAPAANDTDSDDNGSRLAGGDIAARAVTLARAAEPDSGVDGDGTNANQTIDFGLFKPASLGDFVWHDVNANGAQEVGEPGIDGVVVDLYDATNTLVASTTTAGGGLYGFANLIPGAYRVEFGATAGYSQVSPPNAAAATADSDADRATRRTASTTLLAGENDPSWDMGVYNPASLGDLVWEDSNGNGVQDGAEVGLDGVAVDLYDASNTLVSSTSTAAGGAYSFSGLTPGSYSVVITPPAGYQITLQDNASGAAADQVDSDADRITGQTALTTLVSGEDDPTWDVGLYKPASLGNLLWEDLDGDGAQGASEPGVAGRGVTLRWAGPDGALGTGDDTTVTDTTDGSGIYGFANLIPGTYRVEFGANPAHFIYTAQGGGGATDSDVSPADGRTGSIALTSGQDDPTWDAGIYQLLSLGDLVWEDLDNNGAFDSATESGIDGVTVELYADSDSSGDYSPGDALLTSTTTAGGGIYQFSDLAPGDYIVLIPASNFAGGALDGLASSTGASGSATGINEPAGDPDSDQDKHDDGSQTGGDVAALAVTLSLYGEPGPLVDADGTGGNQTVDFGFFQEAALGDLVWEDLNGDGVQDAGEPGVDGVTVTLYDGANAVVGSATTAGGGRYRFSGLGAGGYRVVFSGLPAGYGISPQGQGSAATGSDADQASGSTGAISLTAGQADLGWDAGIYRLLSLGNLVWEDMDNNGAFDSATESGIDGVTVELYRDSDSSGGYSAGDVLVASTATAGGGLYQFSGLEQGDYSLVIPASSMGGALSGYRSSTGAHSLTAGPSEPAGDPDGDIDNSDDGSLSGGIVLTAAVQLSAGGEPDSAVDGDGASGNQTLDFGFFRPASLGDLVWEDADGDGLQGAGEPGVPGVSVTLYDAGADGQPGGGDDAQVGAPQITDASGGYLFTDLPPASYYLVFDKPAVYLFTRRDAGSDDAADSDADRTSGQTIAVVLGSGDDDRRWDAGINQLVGLGDTVWEDLNGDGLQGAGEPGVPDVTVTLYDAATDTQVGAPQITDASGYYQFVNLAPNRYYLIFSDLPAGYLFTAAGQGGDSSQDSDADPASGRTAAIDLLSSQDDPTWDAGIYTLASLGNRVWLDVDGDGAQGAGEKGVNGVTVTLTRADGTPVASTATASAGGEDGVYEFTGLTPGSYALTFSGLPAGMIFSPRDSGGDDAADSDADRASGQSTGFVLSSGAADMSWDAGIYVPASLGNKVWEDSNANGVFDSGEVGVPDVEVELYHSDGTLVGSLRTDSGGSFIFSQLGAGDYYLVFYPPAGWTISPRDQGANNGADSDAEPASGRTAVFTLGSGALDLTWWVGLSRPPTAITLLSFTLEHQARGNLLRWETGVELGTAGFEIYRSATGSRADAALVSEPMVLARGVGVGGARYRWLDASAVSGVSYSYWLVEVEIGGARHEYPLEQPGLRQTTSVWLPLVVRP